jgi:2,4-dihydroxyhept-2-ene-1,7-dioic acid aldolase
MFSSSLKEKLKNKEVAFGTFVKINAPSIIEMLGLAGFDFIIADGEHSSFGYLDIENVIRTADGVGLSSIIRVPSAREEHLQHVLDSGAGGVQIPGLSSVAAVEDALAFLKYYPAGSRGLSFAQRAAKYGFMDKDSYLQASNRDTTVVVHIENKTMADQVETLCRLPGVDVLFVGPADLSQSMGKPGALSDPEVVAVIEKVFATANRYGKSVGIYVASQAALEKYVKLGATYIAWQADVNLFANAAKDAAKSFSQFRNKR